MSREDQRIRARIGSLFSSSDRITKRDTIELSGFSFYLYRLVSVCKRLLPHPAVALVVGAAISFNGRLELPVKSYALLALYVWVVIDIWAWLLPLVDKGVPFKNAHVPEDYFAGLVGKRYANRTVINAHRMGYKYALGCASTWALGLLLGLTMRWWMQDKLADQREDVSKNLVITESLEAGKGPIWTQFTIVNNSSIDLFGRRQLLCYENLAVGNSGTSRLQDIWFSFILDPKSGSPTKGAMGSGSQQPLWNDAPVGPRLRAHGDSETYWNCANVVNFAQSLQCLDMTLTIWYSLDTQPNLAQYKEFRLVGMWHGDNFHWEYRPLELAISPCRAFELTIKRPS